MTFLCRDLANSFVTYRLFCQTRLVIFFPATSRQCPLVYEPLLCVKGSKGRVLYMHMRWDVCIYALECCYLLVCHPSFPSADHLCGQVCYFSATVHRRMQTRIERLCMRQHAKDQCRHVNRSSGVLYLCCSCDKMDRLLFFPSFPLLFSSRR